MNRFLSHLILCALLSTSLVVRAAVPSTADFDGTYFKTNALPISLVGNLTNWSKLATNSFSGGGGNMTNSGAAVVGNVPVATDVSGSKWTPTNNVLLSGLTLTNGSSTVPVITWNPSAFGSTFYSIPAKEMPVNGVSYNFSRGGNIGATTNLLHTFGLNASPGGRDQANAQAMEWTIESDFNGMTECYWQFFDTLGNSARPIFYAATVTNLTNGASQLGFGATLAGFSGMGGFGNYMTIGPNGTDDSVTPGRLTMNGIVLINEKGSTPAEVYFQSLGAGTNSFILGTTRTGGPFVQTSTSTWTNFLFTGINSLQLGGTSSSFAKLAGGTSQLSSRLADDSGYAAFLSGSQTVIGNETITNAVQQVGLIVNNLAGETNQLQTWNAGGTNLAAVSPIGNFIGTGFGFGTATNTGMILNPTTTDLIIQNTGTFVARVRNNAFDLGSAFLTFGSGNGTTVDTFLGRGGAAATFEMGTDGTAPVAQTLKGPSATGANHNGGSVTTQAGASTGSGVPGDLIYQTSLYTNSSGSGVNAYTTRGQIVGRPSALTNATATSFQRFTMATNTQAGIQLFATVTSTDASFNKQSISSSVRVDAVNVNGTITATATETDNTLAANTGTLTIAYTVVDEGSNVLAIRANANSSLTTPTVKIKWVIQSINSDGAITVTPVQL